MRPRAGEAHKVGRSAHVADKRGDRALLCLDVGLRDAHEIHKHKTIRDITLHVGGVQSKGSAGLFVNECGEPVRADVERAVDRALKDGP